MQTSRDIGSLEEGENYICPVCNIPIKLCLGNPSALCKSKVLENTQLSLLSRAVGMQKQHTYGICLLCGKRMSAQQLKRKPLRELCAACEARVERAKISQE